MTRSRYACRAFAMWTLTVGSMWALGCGTTGYQTPADVSGGDVAGATTTIATETLDAQEAVLAVGATLAEVFANREVAILLGHSGEGLPESSCVTGGGFFTFVTLDFAQCTNSASTAQVIVTPFNINMIQFGEGFAFKGYTMLGGFSLAPVDGVPLTWTLVPGSGAPGEPATPIQITDASGNTVDLMVNATVSLRMAGPHIYVWGDGTAGASSATVLLGEEGTTDAVGNPPKWEAPLRTCGCPIEGQTSVGASLTLDGLVIDLDLLTDGDGIGADDFAPFPMDIPDQVFDGSSLTVSFTEEDGCGNYTAGFGTQEDLEVVVSKSDVLAAIDASELSGSEKANVRDGAKANLKDELTLKVDDDVLTESANAAFGSGFDSGICQF